MNSSPQVRSDRTGVLRGLYLILDGAWKDLAEVMQEAASAGVGIVQYRDKTASMREAYSRARTLRNIARSREILFIVNDRCDLAVAVQADGVHLGQQDLSVALARKVVGKSMLIGLSTHTPDQVRAAEGQGADYVGFGPVFSTTTKSDHDPVVGIEGMVRIRNLSPLPIFAIGGIMPSSIPRLREAGADGIAVASGILDAKNRQEAFRLFMEPFDKAL